MQVIFCCQSNGIVTLNDGRSALRFDRLPINLENFWRIPGGHMNPLSAEALASLVTSHSPFAAVLWTPWYAFRESPSTVS